MSHEPNRPRAPITCSAPRCPPRPARCAQEVAQRALISYLRSVFLQPNHAVFDVAALPAAEFALSMVRRGRKSF